MTRPLPPLNHLPRIPKTLAPLVLPDGRLPDHGQYRAILLAGCDLSGQSASYLNIEVSRLRDLSLATTRLYGIQLTDVTLTHVTLAGADWQKPVFHRVELRDCGLAGFSAADAYLHDVLFSECSLTGAHFRFATLMSARFERCILTEADFQGADLTGVLFAGCDLRGAQMSGAKLAGADLRGSALDGLRAGPAELRGAIVDPTQAVALARLLGLIVEWPDPDGGERQVHTRPSPRS